MASEQQSSLTESVYVAKKKEWGTREGEFAFDDEDNAHNWLQDQIDRDPFVDDYVVEQFSKTVYGDARTDTVLGYVKTIERYRNTRSAVDELEPKEDVMSRA